MDEAPHKFDRPEKVNPQNICYWLKEEGILLGGQKNKVKKFVEMDSVRHEGGDIWKVHPIKGYNRTIHTINFRTRSCTCQWSKQYGLDCSHIKAIIAVKFMDRWNNHGIKNAKGLETND